MSLEDLGFKSGNTKATVLGRALDRANGRVLDNDKSPQRKVGEIDNRGSHFYLAMYWARALAEQTDDKALQAQFSQVAAQLEAQEATILAELNGVQGHAVDIGGYYRPKADSVTAAMRPSATLNRIIDAI